MKTPAGNECPYFYGDYFRGRQVEECRLLQAHRLPWKPSLCANCPVPAIARANACPYLQLRPRLSRPWQAFFRQRVQMDAWCEKTRRPVSEPQIGCGECHPLPAVFTEPPHETHPPA